MKNQRRVFRGRGGPTDRRLPKHNARRRQRPPTSHENEAVAIHDKKDAPHRQSKIHLREEPPPVEDAALDGSENEKSDPSDDICVVADEPRKMRVNNNLNVTTSDGVVVATVIETAATEEGYDSSSRRSFQAEVDHLMKRIKNNRQAMQLSKSLILPSNYQKHVLDAVHNTVREWKSIQTHYYADDRSGMEDDNNNNSEILRQEQTKSSNKAIVAVSVAASLFELVQQALQCGPLAGAKPCYMKRCGSEVAQRVLEFLETSFPNHHDCLALGWSEKQANAIEKWKSNARAATDKNAK